MARTFIFAMAPVLTASCWAAGVSTGYSGRAFGTAVHVTAGAVDITSGTTAAAVLCTFAPGITNSNAVASVGLGSILSTGAITTSLSSVASGMTQTSVGTVSVAAVNLLGGIISADALSAVSTASSTPNGFTTSAAGTTFGNLMVLGIPISINVAPNTEIRLPGIGEVVLNEQQSTITASSAQLTVTLLDIHVSQHNALGLPVGSTIKVGSVTSATIATISLLNGLAYGTALSAPPLSLGATAAITLPCGGTTDGQVLSNNTAGITIPAVLEVGATTTSVQGGVSVSSSAAKTTASVAGLNLLAGLVEASTIHAAASGSVTSNGAAFSDQGSSFAELVVAGHPEIGIDPAPNTQVTLAGLGTLYLHRVIQTSTSIEVRMIELVVTLQNVLGLPVGADLRVGVAQVGAVQP